jgi:hypothetical protein
VQLARARVPSGSIADRLKETIFQLRENRVCSVIAPIHDRSVYALKQVISTA